MPDPGKLGAIELALEKKKQLAAAVSKLKKSKPVKVAVKEVPKPTSLASTPKVTTRQKIVHWAMWGCANQPRIHYSEGANRDDWMQAHPPDSLPLWTDCSGFATLCYFMAGAPDPNGLNYRSLGYTGTMVKHMKSIPLSKIRPGDLVVYGTRDMPNGHHVGIVVAVHAATTNGVVTVSHGQESGPFEITVADEARYQPAGITYLSLLP